MMMTTKESAARGTLFAGQVFGSSPVTLRVEGRATPTVAANPLERLAQIMRSNDRLMDELAVGRERVARARAYLDEPTCNARFGAAHLDRCRAKHAGVLAQLRANRIEALDLLAGPDSPAA